MKKYKVMQQVCQPNGMGGVGKAYKQLITSKQLECFEFRPLVQTEQTRGLSIKVIKKYIKEIKEYDPDLIHVRGVLIDGFLALIAARLSGKRKVVMSVHGLYSDFIEAHPLRKMIAKYIMEPLSFCMADAVFTVYEGGTKRKCIRNPSRWLWGFVYNPMPEWDCSLKNKIRGETREELSIAEDKIVVSSISRITYDKGYSVLGEALQLLSAEWPENLIVMIVGQGNYKERFIGALQNEINKGHIVIVGATPDVQKYYFASDVFINPSLHENHSNAILEACAAEIPSIVTNVGGNAETIIDGKTGWVIPSKKPEAIVESLRQVSAKNRQELEDIGLRARQYAESTFSKEIVYSKLARCYADVINKDRKKH